MANTKVQTELPGYRGPYFPAALSRIQKRYQYNAARWHSMVFTDIAGSVHDGEVIGSPTTDDGYTWAFGIGFTFRNVSYIALFPTTYDVSQMSDGTNSDRHVALYVANEGAIDLTRDQRAYATQLFAHNVVTVYRLSYSKAIKDEKEAAAEKNQTD